MASTARTKDEEREFFDSPDVLRRKIEKLAKLVQTSQHFVAFTGAGISTSAGIADYRSGADTVLATGAGKWSKSASEKKGTYKNPKSEPKRVDVLNAIPSPTHMALVSLNAHGFLKHLSSQNVDGLHLLSGFDPKCLSELHGNTKMEICQQCHTRYLRDYRVRNYSNRVHNHVTLRKCAKCRGKCSDSIINFGEDLSDAAWDPAEAHSEKADLCLALGSSLTVTPAADLVETVGENKRGNLVIVNLQKTPHDDLCSVRIFAKCDDAMRMLMDALKLAIPEWKLQRCVFVRIEADKAKTHSILIGGVDADGTP